MKRRVLLFLEFMMFATMSVSASTMISANNPNIHYFGRWDFSDSLAPSHSWPGVCVYAEFEGTSIGVVMNDNFCYYNVIIDDTLTSVFHPTSASVSSYIVASNLADRPHTILLTKRNETTGAKYSFHGFILENGKNLLKLPEKPTRKIEFIGDSYTSASGNEWIDNTKPMEKEAQCTNIYEGFGPITARHYGAQVQMTSQGGYGLLLDWQGNYSNNIPDKFDRTLCYWNLPKWDFEQWIPNLVVICLGLNDCSGFNGYNQTVGRDSTLMFKQKYHDFIAKIRTVYPGVKILAVAADHNDWIRQTIADVVTEEYASGKNDVHFTSFPKYGTGAYVFGDHPTVATHHLIADRLISAIDTLDAWNPSVIDTLPPRMVNLPVSPFTVYDTAFVLKFETDSYAIVHYSQQDIPFNQMELTCTTTGRRNHSTLLYGRHRTMSTYYFRAVDIHGNEMKTSAVVQFQVDTLQYSIPWTSERYQDAGWFTGTAPLGTLNDGVNKTVFSRVTAAYLRKKFSLDSVKVQGFALTMKGHDGAVIYINGDEVYRINMYPDSAIGYQSLAMGVPSTSTQVMGFNSKNGLLNKLKAGENLIAVEIHPSDPTRDIAFDAKFYDAQNKNYFHLGSNWNYSARGSIPVSQIGEKTSGVPETQSSAPPARFQLLQNYPNPFNPSTTITYILDRDGCVHIDIYNSLGQNVSTFVNDHETAGIHSVSFDGRQFSSGVYFYRLISGEKYDVKKMLFIK
ncbi:MAG: T9SS C-terminal target domain-containing protein [Ignavibacteriae bacterium]|nr:MAG: T9SS C-terminal target domain-containing protein [Ignavibacteriota bacterium]